MTDFREKIIERKQKVMNHFWKIFYAWFFIWFMFLFSIGFYYDFNSGYVLLTFFAMLVSLGYFLHIVLMEAKIL